MKSRIWYPQFDVYDTVRRICVILFEWREGTPALERLCIIDFYFANPPLLHNVKMNRNVKRSFLTLELPHPKSTFLSYPEAPILFSKMKPIQTTALNSLIGKGLIDADFIKMGSVKFTSRGEEFVERRFVPTLTESDRSIAPFLTKQFTELAYGDIGDVRKITKLRWVT